LVPRISLKRYSTNLNESDSYGYIQHRLDVAGYKGAALFSQEALRMIWQYSEGIPRKINILCDNALLMGYGMEQKKIGLDIILEAIRDLSWSPFLDNPSSSYALAGDTRLFSMKQPAEPTLQPHPTLKPGETMPPFCEEVKYPHVKVSAGPEAEVKNPLIQDERREPQTADMQSRHGEYFLGPVGIEAQSPDEVVVHESVFMNQGILRNTLNRIRFSLIAGILLLLCLIIGAWLLFVKSDISLGQYLFSIKQIVRTEITGLLHGSLDRTTGQTEPQVVEDPRTSMQEDSRTKLR
jgi:hypothetical protein